MKIFFNLLITILICQKSTSQTHLNASNLASLCDCNPSTSLRYISVYGKQITSIDPITFNSLSSLQVLDLSGIQIYSVVANTFKCFLNLRTLYLESNRIVSFDVTLKKYVYTRILILFLFPTLISKLCDGNPKCKVYLTTFF